MTEGVEDSYAWKHALANDPNTKKPVDVCRICKKPIAVWHCRETGCPWCKACTVAK